MESVQTRDIIVIGSSMGGIEALSSLARHLPADLPASLLVVQHTSDESPGLLSQILSRGGALLAVTAENGMTLERGRIYVAPPDQHMLLTERGPQVVFGPRENRARPAIDPLFRTAAVSFRSRVIGVILTGLLGDGASGLLAVRRCGGAAVVQAPDDAAYSEMPRRALAAVPDAHQTTLSELGPLLARLTREPAPTPPPVPEILRIEAHLTERSMITDDWGGVPSHATDFTCPECQGSIRQIDDGPMHRYRCRVGHAFSSDALVGEKDRQVEEALWLALQTLQERSQMLETMAREDRRRGWNRNAEDLEDRARESQAGAERLRQLVVTLAR